MRINVYSQELTSATSLVSKTDERGVTHYGVRIYLASSLLLHHTADDDDRSAITYWVPHSGPMAEGVLAEVLRRAADLVCLAPRPEQMTDDQADSERQ